MTSTKVRHPGEMRLFPRHRVTILDVLRASKSVPSFPLLKTIRVQELDALRRSCSSRIGWTTIFARAYGIVCQQIPELRDMYVSHPISYLYRHPETVCSIAIHRKDDQDQERLIFGRIPVPEQKSLLHLQEELHRCATAPMREAYREGLMLEKCPWFYRRIVWNLLMHWSGRKRAKHVGTFSISSLGGYGALNGYHPLITTSSLAFGPIDAQGAMDIVLLCDHRSLDGMLGARALASLEHCLNSQILQELNEIAQANPRAQVA